MATTVWLGVRTIGFPRGGGHAWAYLNWALSLRAAGCDVVWLERPDGPLPPEQAREALEGLRERLKPYGLDGAVALSPRADGRGWTPDRSCLPLEAARDADLLLSMGYGAFEFVKPLFRRTAVLDIDPGLSQIWAHEGFIDLSGFDAYFTVGETVGTAGAAFPSAGFDWHYVPRAVALDYWPVAPTPPTASFTTVSQWGTSKQWFVGNGTRFHNDKRHAFEPLLELPSHTSQSLELALGLSADHELRLDPDEAEEKERLERLGWRVIHAHGVSSTPSDYQRYVAASKGEFSCAKPSCLYLKNAWLSDRTVCYLASGKPAVVEHTGPSRLLPDDAGLFRFNGIEDAARALETVAADYERQCRLARSLAEELFDGRGAVTELLERALA